MTFSMIKKNYDKGLWGKAMVKVAVAKGIISEDEYKTITGAVYSA